MSMEFKPSNGSGKKDYDFQSLGPEDWLNDEKVWQELEQNTNYSKKASRFGFSRKKQSPFDGNANIGGNGRTSQASGKIELKINVTFPKFKKLTKLFNRIKKHKRVAAYSLITTVVILVSIYFFAEVLNKGDAKEVAGVSQVAGRNPSDPLPKDKPSFQLLYPGNKNEDTVGEVVRVSPDGNEPAYAYTDNIGSSEVQISQQKIPEAFKDAIDANLEKTATDFQATESFEVDNIKVYHGKSSSGIESLIFIKGNLLIFIKSSEELSEEAWAAYISALHD